MTLKISISGVRGIVGDSLTEDVISDFAAAFSKYLGHGKIVVGTDARVSYQFVKDIVISSLCRSSSSVTDIGIAPTPTVQLYTKKHGASGAIIITASHNPPEWNGLKFVRSDGIFLNETQAGELIGIYNDISKRAHFPHDSRMFSAVDEKSLEEHIALVLKNVDADAIRKKAFKVAIDCCNGAGCVITRDLLRQLGCEIIAINCDVGSIPKRGLEPIPENLGELSSVVKRFGADIGFAQDPDADRLAIVSDEGKPVGEEYSIVIAADLVLSRQKSKKTVVVTNLSTSRMVDDITRKYGATVLRTKVGEVNVSEKMKATGAVIGGEGNGGVIYPPVGFGRDSITGIGLVLEYLALNGGRLSNIIGKMPRYHMIKDKISLNDTAQTNKLLDKVKDMFKSGKIDVSDGVKIDLDEGWVHVRPSNTEPIVRIMAEAKDIVTAKGLIEGVKRLV